MENTINIENIFQIIDILLKIILGVIIVLYIHNRNNKTKKKEILYNLYLQLIEYSAAQLEYNYDYIEYNLMERIYSNAFFDEEKKILANIKSLKKVVSKKMKANVHIGFKLQHTLEAIKLILGKLKTNKKDMEMESNAIDIWYYFYEELYNNEEIEKEIRQITNEIIQKYHGYNKGLLDEYELDFYIENATSTYLTKQKKYHFDNYKNNVRPFLNHIKKWIDEL